MLHMDSPHDQVSEALASDRTDLIDHGASTKALNAKSLQEGCLPGNVKACIGEDKSCHRQMLQSLEHAKLAKSIMSCLSLSARLPSMCSRSQSEKASWRPSCLRELYLSIFRHFTRFSCASDGEIAAINADSAPLIVLNHMSREAVAFSMRLAAHTRPKTVLRVSLLCTSSRSSSEGCCNSYAKPRHWHVMTRQKGCDHGQQ